jgi:hypothetical protein
MFINNGIQFANSNTTPVEYTTVFSQTFGPRLVYKEADKKVSWNTAFYYQTGKDNQNRSLSAYDFLAEVAFQVTKALSLTGGLELLSGTDEVGANPQESESFNPLYGTNHRFNGYMDYFYVGNHFNSVGLQDFYLKGLISRPKVFFGASVHFFNAGADVNDDSQSATVATSKLGTELDLTMNYNVSSGISLQGGYSQMFATKSLEYLKNTPGGSNQTNNWAYLMLILRPGMEWPRTGLKL